MHNTFLYVNSNTYVHIVDHIWYQIHTWLHVPGIHQPFQTRESATSYHNRSYQTYGTWADLRVSEGGAQCRDAVIINNHFRPLESPSKESITTSRSSSARHITRRYLRSDMLLQLGLYQTLDKRTACVKNVDNTYDFYKVVYMCAIMCFVTGYIAWRCDLHDVWYGSWQWRWRRHYRVWHSGKPSRHTHTQPRKMTQLTRTGQDQSMLTMLHYSVGSRMKTRVHLGLAVEWPTGVLRFTSRWITTSVLSNTAWTSPWWWESSTVTVMKFACQSNLWETC